MEKGETWLRMPHVLAWVFLTELENKKTTLGFVPYQLLLGKHQASFAR